MLYTKKNRPIHEKVNISSTEEKKKQPIEIYEKWNWNSKKSGRYLFIWFKQWDVCAAEPPVTWKGETQTNTVKQIKNKVFCFVICQAGIYIENNIESCVCIHIHTVCVCVAWDYAIYLDGISHLLSSFLPPPRMTFSFCCCCSIRVSIMATDYSSVSRVIDWQTRPETFAHLDTNPVPPAIIFLYATLALEEEEEEDTVL